jgi:hypothetical protein
MKSSQKEHKITDSCSNNKRRMRRRDTSRRSSTMTVMPHLLHKETTTTKIRLRKKTVNQNYSFDYSRIPYNFNAHLSSLVS